MEEPDYDVGSDVNDRLGIAGLHGRPVTGLEAWHSDGVVVVTVREDVTPVELARISEVLAGVAHRVETRPDGHGILFRTKT